MEERGWEEVWRTRSVGTERNKSVKLAHLLDSIRRDEIKGLFAFCFPSPLAKKCLRKLEEKASVYQRTFCLYSRCSDDEC